MTDKIDISRNKTETASDRVMLLSRSFDGMISEAMRFIAWRRTELNGQYPEAIFVNRLIYRALRRAIYRRLTLFHAANYGFDRRDLMIMSTEIRTMAHGF
jgi:hypothetical protein